MTSNILILFSILSAGPSWAFSNLHCVSNSEVVYSARDLVGGVRPFPGMVKTIEEVRISNVPIYRVVTREDCGDKPDCVPQQPELGDIRPAGFSLSFFPDTKKILSTVGSPTGPIFHEEYAIQFHLRNDPPIWMLCDFFKVFAP